MKNRSVIGSDSEVTKRFPPLLYNRYCFKAALQYQTGYQL